MADHEYLPAETPSTGAGQRLLAAREAAGLTLAQISAQTKIPTRVLTLIEAGDFSALPSRTYAIGFTRNYARALGLDEEQLVTEVRQELGHGAQAEAEAAPTFEPGDPARVPTARFAWAAAIGALAVIVAGLLLWRTYYVPAVTLPTILPEETATPSLIEAASLAPAPLATGAGMAGADAAMATGAPAGMTGPAIARPAAPPVRRSAASSRPAPALAGVAAADPQSPPQPAAEADPISEPAPASTAQN